MMSKVNGAHRTVQVRIEGRVQGVGYRMWAKQTAEELGLRGWVRNRHDGSVEALFSGPRDAVAAMLEACAEGPRGATVNGAVVIVEGGYVPAAFAIRPTA